MNLVNRNVLLTGASRGLGAALLKQLCEKGATVYATSREPERYDWPQGVIPIALDLSTPESTLLGWTESKLDQVDIDILINNAGAGFFGSVSASKFECLDAQISLLLRSPVALCQAVLVGMLARGSGVIVNVSSLANEYPVPYMSGYNAAKSGLSAFSRSLMTELGGSGVSVIDFCPGDIDTGFNDQMLRGGLSEADKQKADSVWKVMVNRMGKSPKPERIARDLLRSIERGESALVRSGSFFQRKLAPFFVRIASSRWQRRENERYYNLKP